MPRLFARGLLAAALAVGALTGAPAVSHAAQPAAPAGISVRGACDAGDNLGEIANNFISRCRKASIRQVFPGEHYGDTLGEIRDCRTKSCKTAWKLLNDGRFKK
ncbi:hypothetical protein LO772_04950 [Yinghuangia sp. ASG 101]|uniref:hypothetical protein n=1 Tax=Yinghuangia sp. ASG 101 TaxID=2896848 RepID=UPI001E3E3878|nr:hypothetical protein [Yinghuangia sp. ASG 101]UGQ12973.1 hypothetical protein LO772_04950 [Yinghuangia sp. ASG 101]